MVLAGRNVYALVSVYVPIPSFPHLQCCQESRGRLRSLFLSPMSPLVRPASGVLRALEVCWTTVLVCGRGLHPCIIRVSSWFGVAKWRRCPEFGIKSSPPFPCFRGVFGAGGGRVDVGFRWIWLDPGVCAGLVGIVVSARAAATAFVLRDPALFGRKVAARVVSSLEN